MYIFLSRILFLLRVFYVISTELTVYFIYKDYYYFIKRLVHELASINILYVKVFQSIASNKQLIDEKTNNELIKFTDNAPWNYSDTRFEEFLYLRNEYNIHMDNGMYEKPINSGMISLVFKGYKKDTQQKVIIKMKRNNIDAKLQEAIENLHFFINIFNLIPQFKKYQISEIIKKNIYIIRDQTNFSKEVQNIVKMRENCQNLKYVVIPEVYKEITDKYSNFIVMEFIDGMKLNEVEEKDYEQFSKQVVKFGIVTTVIHGFAHGDLHAGNILFIKDENSNEKYKYKIGVFDFGIMYEINSSFKELWYDILFNLFNVSPKETAIKLLNSRLIEPTNAINLLPHEVRANIIDFTTEIIDGCIKNPSKGNQKQIYEFLCKLYEYLNGVQTKNVQFRPSDDFVKTQLAIAMAHGVTYTLTKNNCKDISEQVINELFHANLLTE